MSDFQKHRHWSQQIEAIAREISRLALVCDIKLGQPGLAERILKNDDTVCGKKNAESFRRLRQHLMALFPLEEHAVERLGAADTKEILDRVRESVLAIRNAGGSKS
jgi:hypothetical protein